MKIAIINECLFYISGNIVSAQFYVNKVYRYPILAPLSNL